MAPKELLRFSKERHCVSRPAADDSRPVLLKPFSRFPNECHWELAPRADEPRAVLNEVFVRFPKERELSLPEEMLCDRVTLEGERLGEGSKLDGAFAELFGARADFASELELRLCECPLLPREAPLRCELCPPPLDREWLIPRDPPPWEPPLECE